MIIVVDGYNLLKKALGGEFISEKKRNAFINLMGKYSQKKGHKIIVVFDAGPCMYPLTEKYHRVTVIYSGEYQSADDIIMKFVEEHENKNILVVTQDREIVNAVERCNEDVIDPEEFYKKVKDVFHVSQEVVQKRNTNLIKITEDSDGYLDSIMHEAASMKLQHKDENDEYLVPIHHQEKGEKVAKKQKKRMKKVDKL